MLYCTISTHLTLSSGRGSLPGRRPGGGLRPSHRAPHQGQVPRQGGGREGPDLRPPLPAHPDRCQDLVPRGDEERDLREPAGLQGAQPPALAQVGIDLAFS